MRKYGGRNVKDLGEVRSAAASICAAVRGADQFAVTMARPEAASKALPRQRAAVTPASRALSDARILNPANRQQIRWRKGERLEGLWLARFLVSQQGVRPGGRIGLLFAEALDGYVAMLAALNEGTPGRRSRPGQHGTDASKHRDCTLIMRSELQSDSREVGIFKSDHIHPGSDCTADPGAFAHYQVTMDDESLLEAGSLMKGTHVPAE